VPAELVLVRHAAYLEEEHYAADGRWDPDLSPDGFAQAEALAGRLTEYEPRLVISSPLRRCVRTAEAVIGATGAELVVDGRWAEFHRGEHEQRRDAGVESTQEWQRWPGGETRDEFRTRLTAALDDARRRGSRKTVVCTHGGAINELLALVLGMAPRTVFRTDLTGLSRLAFDGDRVVVTSVNDAWHLQDPLSVPATMLDIQGAARAHSG
jgi:broad specificity phosphatase PhoE